MACILHLETSTNVCSVAFSENGNTLFRKESYEGQAHAVLLGIYVEEALQAARTGGLMPDAVAVSSGPGSYTGLRIGISMAKGLCFGYGIPLISVPTLELLASTAFRRHVPEADFLCPMLDARRMEVYTAVYDAAMQLVQPARAEVVTPESYTGWQERGRVCFFGNGAAKCREVISPANALFLENVYPLAADMVPLAEAAFAGKRFEDVAYFEPFYLKEFQATVPKNKVLGIRK